MRTLLFIAALLSACDSGFADPSPHPTEGVYHIDSGYQSETLELQRGHFRYWFWTDYGPQSRDCPLEGAYSIDGFTLTMHRDDIHLGNQRIFHPVKGFDVLWRPQALELWLTTGKVNWYGFMARVAHPPDNLSNSNLFPPIPPEIRRALRNW
jgi:hypothetical protein